jgi:hypothetical protein
MSTRDTIAAALSSVDGVTGTATPPDVLAPGSAWPTWVAAGPSAYGGLQDTWHVMIVLPNPTMAATVEAADPLVDTAFAALLDVGEVALVEPVTIASGDPAGTGQGVPALRFVLTTIGVRP